MANLETTEAAAKAVSMSRFFLYRYATKIPACYRAGRVLRWDIQALRAWMRNQQEGKTKRLTFRKNNTAT